MDKRTMDELISYFNQEVSKMDISQENKMKLLGMITAIGYENKKQELVRCGECKYWSEVDTSDGLRYGQCDRPGSAIRGNCFIRESWFCADGEREVQE